MPNIKELDFDKEQGRVWWMVDEQSYSIYCDNIDQLILDEPHNAIILLAGNGKLPDQLLVFSAFGDQLFKLSPPPGFHFYYLTKHPELSVAVVCVSSMPVDGWRDWHFGIDFENKSIFRHCPAY